MHPWGQFGAQGPRPHGEGPVVGYCHHTGAWGRQEGKTGLVDCCIPAAMVPFSAFSSPSPSSHSSNPWPWHRSWCIRGENSPSWGPAPYKPPLPSSPSPPPQPRARGAAEGLGGFPPNLRPHVPAWIPVERSPPHGSRRRFSHPGLGALPGPVCGSRFVRLSPPLAAEAVGAGAARSPLTLHPCPGPRRVLKRLPPLPDVPRAFPGRGSPGSSSC